MGEVVKITSKNVVLCEKALRALRDNLAEFVTLTLEYPVEFAFGDYRFVFTSEQNITDLIAVLDAKINAYRAAA